MLMLRPPCITFLDSRSKRCEPKKSIQELYTHTRDVPPPVALEALVNVDLVSMLSDSVGIINPDLEPLEPGLSLRRWPALMTRSKNPLNLPFRRFSRGRLGSDIVVRKRELMLCGALTSYTPCHLTSCPNRVGHEPRPALRVDIHGRPDYR